MSEKSLDAALASQSAALDWKPASHGGVPAPSITLAATGSSTHNICVDGERFDLSAEYVIESCAEREAEAAGA
jgi:hypothetical protein